jgi:hypothetical protein
MLRSYGATSLVLVPVLACNRWRLGDDFSYGQVALRGLASGFWLGN